MRAQRFFPAQTESRLPHLLFLFGVLLFLGYAAYFYRGAYSIFDDSFITFRYADNLAHGQGLVFNPGERVEGYTTFLWAVLMAAAIKLGGDVIAASQVVGATAGMGILWLTFRLGKRYRQPMAGALAALMLAGTAGFARYAVSGFEILFFTFLLLLGTTLYLNALERGWHIGWAGVVFALAAMTRPEGVLVFGLVSLHFAGWLWKQPDIAPRTKIVRLAAWAVSFGALYGAYFLWRWHFYGYLLPNTFYVKVGQPGTLLFKRGLTYLFLMAVVSNPQIPFLALAALWWKKSATGKTLFLFAVVGYAIYLAVVGGDDYKNFGIRFLLPLLPWIYLAGTFGFVEKFSGLSSAARSRATVIFFSSLMIIFGLWSAPERSAYQTVIDWRWVDLAQWLETRAQPTDTLAVDAAGTLPFYTGLRTIDMFGLNDTRIAHLSGGVGAGTAGHEKSDPAYVLAQQPTYIASWINRAGEPIAAGLPSVAAEFSRHYRLRVAVLMHTPSDPNIPIIVDGATFTLAMHENGYIYGLFQRID